MSEAQQATLTLPDTTGITETEQDRAMRKGISFNGTYFVYRGFQYDRLLDAFAYAEHDIKHADRQQEPAVEWLARSTPSAADQAIMQEMGICFEAWRYRFREYRYDRLADAVHYARDHQP